MGEAGEPRAGAPRGRLLKSGYLSRSKNFTSRLLRKKDTDRSDEAFERQLKVIATVKSHNIWSMRINPADFLQIKSGNKVAEILYVHLDWSCSSTAMLTQRSSTLAHSPHQLRRFKLEMRFG